MSTEDKTKGWGNSILSMPVPEVEAAFKEGMQAGIDVAFGLRSVKPDQDAIDNAWRWSKAKKGLK